MITDGKGRCATEVMCDIGLRHQLDWVFWPAKWEGTFNPIPMDTSLVFHKWAGYFQDRSSGRGRHTTITLCEAHARLVAQDNEDLAMEEIMLEEWCEAYYNRKRDHARKVIQDQRDSSHAISDPMDSEGMAEGWDNNWG